MTRTKRMTAAVLTLVLLLNFAGCGAKNALFDRVSGAGKFAAESLTIYEEKGSFAAEPKTVRDAKQAEEIFGAFKDVTLGEVVKTDDKYTRYIFTFADASGSKMSFTLREDGCVVLGGKTYDALGTDTVFEAAGIDPDEETAESKTEASSEASNAQTEPEMTPEPEVTVTPEPTAEPTPEATYTLVGYDGGVFTMQLPQGWQIVTGGEYAGYSIRAWDPNDPDVQIFYYGELGPYFKSAEAKAQYHSMSTSNDPLRYMPVLEDLYQELRRQEEKEAQYVATALEIYVTGSLNVFNHRTNVDIQNRIVAFDIKELGKQLKKIGMLVVQDQVWNRVTVNREAHKATRYYIDEFHLLLKEEQTAAYSVEIWKRFRKWGGVPTGITQNVKDLLASREVENIFENSDYIYMLNQASGDRQILAKQLNISPHQLSYVTHSGEGEGLLFYGNIILPFVDRFPKDTELYRVMTTKPNEVSGA